MSKFEVEIRYVMMDMIAQKKKQRENIKVMMEKYLAAGGKIRKVSVGDCFKKK